MEVYVLHVMSGKELDVRNSIMNKGYEAAVPRENRLIHKSGEWQTQEYILFPGYVFISLDELTDNIYYDIMPSAGAPNGVIKFLGTKAPTPISEAEAIQIGLLAANEEPLEPSVVEFDEHGTPRIVCGILKDFAPISYDKHRRRAQVYLNVHNKAKTAEFSFVPTGVNNEKRK